HRYRSRDGIAPRMARFRRDFGRCHTPSPRCTGMRIEAVMQALAEEQHGAVASWQLRAQGATYSELRRIRESDGWHSRTRRVFARAGAPMTDEQRLMVAVLDASPGAAIAAPTAGWVWGAPGFRVEPMHVVRPRGISRRASPVAVIHEVVDLHPHHIKVVKGIPVISPARLVCELAAMQ